MLVWQNLCFAWPFARNGASLEIKQNEFYDSILCVLLLQGVGPGLKGGNQDQVGKSVFYEGRLLFRAASRGVTELQNDLLP